MESFVYCHYLFQFCFSILFDSDWLTHLHQNNISALSCVLIATSSIFSILFYFLLHTADTWISLFFSSRLLNFGQSGSFVVTVAIQSLVVIFANFALRKILRIYQILITITLKVPIAHAEGLILTQKLRSRLKWYNAVYVRTGFMRIILVLTLFKRYSTFNYLLKLDHIC